MSKIHFERVTCPDCKMQGQFKVYDSINIDEETKMDRFFKRRIIEDSIFLYECPNCKNKFYIEYPFLYNDIKNNFMVWCLPDMATEAEIENIKKVDMRTYNGTLRIALGKFEFIDKLNVFENKLDDIAIESIKTFAFSKISDNDKKETKSFMFNGINGETKNLEFVLIKNDETSKLINVPLGFYGEIKDRIKEKEVKGFNIIDQASYYNYIEND